MNVDVNSVKRVIHTNSSYPTHMNLNLTCVTDTIIEDDDHTVITSNCDDNVQHRANAMNINPHHAIADTGATSIFVMAGTPVDNIRPSNKPIHISLPDGKQIVSAQVCDINIPGLPITLTGHIVPDMKMASLLGIRVLCKAGCKVIFDDQKCRVIFKGTTILTGHKDPTSDLWIIPLPPTRETFWTTQRAVDNEIDSSTHPP